MWNLRPRRMDLVELKPNPETQSLLLYKNGIYYSLRNTITTLPQNQSEKPIHKKG
jgi:hypothetical protein